MRIDTTLSIVQENALTFSNYFISRRWDTHEGHLNIQTEVFQQDLDLFQTARIRPTVDFADLENVLVLTAFEAVDFERELSPPAETEN